MYRRVVAGHYAREEWLSESLYALGHESSQHVCQSKYALLDVHVPFVTILFPEIRYRGAGLNDQFFVTLEARLQAIVVSELGIFELLEDEREVEDQEEVRLHLKTVQQELEVTLQNFQYEEYYPRAKIKMISYGRGRTGAEPGRGCGRLALTYQYLISLILSSGDSCLRTTLTDL